MVLYLIGSKEICNIEKVVEDIYIIYDYRGYIFLIGG